MLALPVTRPVVPVRVLVPKLLISGSTSSVSLSVKHPVSATSILFVVRSTVSKADDQLD